MSMEHDETATTMVYTITAFDGDANVKAKEQGEDTHDNIMRIGQRIALAYPNCFVKVWTGNEIWGEIIPEYLKIQYGTVDNVFENHFAKWN